MQVHDRSLDIQVDHHDHAVGIVSKICSTVAHLIRPPSNNAQALKVAQFSPRYRLSFSLLNEDASAGDAIARWHIKDAISSKHGLQSDEWMN